MTSPGRRFSVLRPMPILTRNCQTLQIPLEYSILRVLSTLYNVGYGNLDHFGVDHDTCRI
jgi:hypothetical protein